MDLLLCSFKFLLFLSLTSFSSVLIIKLLKIDDIIEKIILIFIFNWAQIILIIQVLSLFHKITNLSIMISHIIVFIFSLIITKLKKVNIKIDLKYLWRITKDKYSNLKINKILKIIILIWLIVIIVSTFFIGITVPPKNYDSMTYHLTRAAFWKQHQSIDHYLSRNIRQLENPVNAEIGILWTMLFTNSDGISFLVQWSALIIILLTLYRLLRLLNFKPIISFVSSFIFTTLNMVIFQSSSTQNDLITACFILLVIYFSIKVFEDKNIDFIYIIFAGLTAGLAIGTKGYSYLFVPGILIFIIFFKKNTKIKWKKILYLILFSVTGVLLFASYNFVQNYLDFGNIFSSSGTINLMRVENPNIKTLLSNILRNITSFYQLKDYDQGTISTMLQKLNNLIHSGLNLGISSPATTWPGTEFYLSGFALNMDFAYFGPIGSLIIIPAIIYNAIIFTSSKRLRNNKDILRKYKNTLLFSMIPIVFFLLYSYIFKWQPWAGRLMTAFVLLMMPGFAMLFEFFSYIRIKKIFNLIIALLLVITVLLSSKVLFNNWDYRIVSIGGDSILSVDYKERRFVNSPPHIKEIKKIVEKNIDSDGKLGLITSGDDWDYIYFGDRFERTLFYILEKDYIEKDLQQIILNNKLDGIVINTLSVPFLPEERDLSNIEIEGSGNYQLYYIP